MTRELPNVPFHKNSPHIMGDDAVPVIETRRIAGHETVCLRWYGEADGQTIWHTLFFFPLQLDTLRPSPFQGEPTDYAVLFVGNFGKCRELDANAHELERHGFKPEDGIVWLANMDRDRPHSFLAKTVAIGDPMRGVIQPRSAWLPDHHARFFQRTTD